jgi:hypothetical protein
MMNWIVVTYQIQGLFGSLTDERQCHHWDLLRGSRVATGSTDEVRDRHVGV